MKRSRTIELALMGAAPLLFAGCDRTPPLSAQLYQNLQQCVREGKVSPEVCAQAYADAVQAQYRGAPRFDSLAQCEAQFGYGQCHAVTAGSGGPAAQGAGPPAGAYSSPGAYSSSGGHWFVPALAGFLVGRALGPHYHYGWGGYAWHGYARPGGFGGFNGQPIYRARGDRGEWQTAQGRRFGYGMRGPAAGSVGEALSRGGFGHSGAARFSWGG